MQSKFPIAKAYIGERADTLVFSFQETCRRLANEYVKEFRMKDKDIKSKWYILAIIVRGLELTIPIQMEDVKSRLIRWVDDKWKGISGLFQVDAFKELTYMEALKTGVNSSKYHTPSDFVQFVKDEMNALPKFPHSVNDIATRCLCWPRGITSFPPFIRTTIKIPVKIDVSEFQIGFQSNPPGALMFLPGPNSKVDILDEIWKVKDKWMPSLMKFKGFGFEKLVRPKGLAHITVLNSMEVEKVGRKMDLSDAIDRFNKYLSKEPTTFEVLGVSHTYDERYTHYETVVVLEVECRIVNSIKTAIEIYTSEKLNPGTHITFAVRLRE